MRKFLRGLGIGIIIMGALYGVVLSWQLLYANYGTVGAVAGLVAAPVLVVLVPWYALFVGGFWFPLVFTYGCGIVGGWLYSAGDEPQPRPVS